MLRIALTICVLLSARGLARADDIKFCFKTTGTYNDNNVGEDYWTLDVARESRGAYVRLYKSNVQIWEGFTGDGIGAGDPGAGCTPTLSVSGVNDDYDLWLRTEGEVDGNSIVVRDAETEGIWWVVRDGHLITEGSGTYSVTLNPAAGILWNLFNVYNTAAFALYVWSAGLSGETFEFRVDDTGGSRNQGGLIYIDDSHPKRKFVQVHEIGHRIASLLTGGQLLGADCDQNSATCPYEGSSSCTYPSESACHSMRSKEYSRCASQEGFAHFVSADVWNNNTSDNDCYFEYYKEVEGDATPLVDCDAANTNFPVQWYEDNCSTASGYSVELDWLRAFWHVRTENTTYVSQSTIIGWLHDATPWDDTHAYQNLDSQANTVSGQLNYNWDQAKVAHGIDW